MIKEKDKIYLVIGIALLAIFVLAFQDIVGLNMWSTLGGFESEAYAKAEPFYQAQFWTFSHLFIVGVALVYWLFRKDLSETLAIILVYEGMILAGLEDILYFFFQGISIPSTLPYLDNTLIMGNVAKLFGTGVTPLTLWTSVIGMSIVLYFIVKWLKNVNTTIMGVKI